MPAANPVTDLTICNAALTLIGMPVISSLDDTDDSAVLCKLHYPLTKRGALSRYDWPWGIKQLQLAIDAVDTPLTQYTNAYKLPSDRLADAPILVTTTAEVSQALYKDYVIQGVHLLTNSDTIFIWYNSVDLELEGRWPDYFVDFMTYALASRLSMGLIEREDTAARMQFTAWGADMAIPGGMYAVARRRSFESLPPVVIEDYELIIARLSGI